MDIRNQVSAGDWADWPTLLFMPVLLLAALPLVVFALPLVIPFMILEKIYEH